MGEKSLEATFTISWGDVCAEMHDSLSKEQIEQAEGNKEGIMNWVQHNIADYFAFSYEKILADTIKMIKGNQ